jgi:hypothetical protein
MSLIFALHTKKKKKCMANAPEMQIGERGGGR